MRTEHNTEGHGPGGGEDNLVRTMARTAQAMRRHLEKTIADVPGGMSAWWVLRHLHHAGPQAQADMARSVGVAGSTLTRRLEQMEGDGLITRTGDPEDGRRVIVALSEAGEATRGRTARARRCRGGAPRGGRRTRGHRGVRPHGREDSREPARARDGSRRSRRGSGHAERLWRRRRRRSRSRRRRKPRSRRRWPRRRGTPRGGWPRRNPRRPRGLAAEERRVERGR